MWPRGQKEKSGWTDTVHPDIRKIYKFERELISRGVGNKKIISIFVGDVHNFRQSLG